jgi:hypothetical protein
LLIPSGSPIGCKLVQTYHHHLCSFLRAVLWTSLLSFQRGRCLHNVQSFASHSLPVEDLTIRFSIFSSMVFLKIMPDVLSFLRHSCHLTPRFLMPLLHSSPLCRLFSTVRPLLLRPLHRAGTAQRVISLWAAINRFWDPPSPWVHFFCCRLRLMARCQSPFGPPVLR